MTGKEDSSSENSFYASLAIYSKDSLSERIKINIDLIPQADGKRGDNFHWIFSTKEIFFSENIEDHLDFLKEKFIGSTKYLSSLKEEGAEFRVWIFFKYGGFNGGINGSFVVSEEIVGWLSLFGADLYIDVWA